MISTLDNDIPKTKNPPKSSSSSSISTSKSSTSVYNNTSSSSNKKSTTTHSVRFKPLSDSDSFSYDDLPLINKDPVKLPSSKPNIYNSNVPSSPLSETNSQEKILEDIVDVNMQSNEEEENYEDDDDVYMAPLIAGRAPKSTVTKSSQKPILKKPDLATPTLRTLSASENNLLSPTRPSTTTTTNNTGRSPRRDEDLLMSPTRSQITSVVDPVTPSATQSERPENPQWMNLNDHLEVSTINDLPSDQQIPQFFAEDVLEEDGSLRFFWTDYFDFGSNLGLFGKVKNQTTGKFGSMFLVIKNIQRELYFLPRTTIKQKESNNEDDDDDEEGGTEVVEQYEIQDVYDEVCEVLAKHGISDFRSKPVTRKYCFELPDIPKETQYLQILYNYESNSSVGNLPTDIEGTTFSHVFGTHTNLFEQFVLSRNIMGPCWLEIKTPDLNSIRNASWCNLDVSVNSPLDVSVITDTRSPALATPPMTLMSLSIRTIMNKKDNKQEIAAISARVYTDIDHDSTVSPDKLPSVLFTYVRPFQGVFPMGFKRLLTEREKASGRKSTITTFYDESELLSEFLKQVQRFDPDVYVGHALDNVHFNILTHRIKQLKVSGWSRLGRCRQRTWPQSFSRGGGGGQDIAGQRQVAAGRLMLDISNTYGQSLTLKCDSWTLTEMVKLYLTPQERLDQPLDATKSEWITSASGACEYLVHNETDTYFVLAIALKTQMLALSKQLTNIAGNSWSRTLTGTRAERNEYILLHEFHRQEYILPDKYPVHKKKKNQQQQQQQQQSQGNNSQSDNEKNETATSSSWNGSSQQPSTQPQQGQSQGTTTAGAGPSRKKPKYKGGLVFEPKRGLYDKIILVMDFNSLYPSIIQEFNICFTTVDRHDYNIRHGSSSVGSNTNNGGAGGEEEGFENDGGGIVYGGGDEGGDEGILEVPDRSIAMGIFPRLVQTLVQRRRAVKSSMKDSKATPIQLAQWDIKQQALKLTANSMYGCLGFPRSRFYARPLAELTTFKGREILMATRDLAESIGLQVIYGDTDSVMINTNVDLYDEALKIGVDFKKQVNERYRLLEIDIDNVFRRMLLHAKKKYAAVKMSGPEKPSNDGGSIAVANHKLDMEVKGLDMKRREYCVLSKEASRYALDQILGNESAETATEKIHEYLRQLSGRVRGGSIPLGQFIIRNKLSKNPKDYPGGTKLPHVVVAQRRLDHGEIVRPDDVISYIISEEVEEKDEEKDDEEGNKENIEEEGGNIYNSTKPTTTKVSSSEFNSGGAAQRALTRKEIEDGHGKFRPDSEYYLSHQILPPLERLMAPMAGTDSMRLADCLGLDLKKYLQSHQHKLENDNNGEGGVGGTGTGSNSNSVFSTYQSTIDDSIRFRDAENLELLCGSCRYRFVFTGLLQGSFDNEHQDSHEHNKRIVNENGIQCPECHEEMNMTRVNAQLETQLRSHITRYYAGWVICGECGIRTRQLGVYGRRCLAMTESSSSSGSGSSTSGSSGGLRQCGGLVSNEYSDLRVNNQMTYYDSLFDVDRAKRKAENEYRQKLKMVADSNTNNNNGGVADLVTNARKEFQIVSALAEQNRERFGITRGVIDKYLSQSGRRYVDMKDIFSFV